MTPYDEIRVLLALIPEGTQGENQLCPFCRGGRTREITLSIYRHFGNNGAYKCNRANCGKEGYIGERFSTNWTPENRKKEFQPRIYQGLIEELPNDVIQYYCRKYGWSEAELRESGCGWDYDYHRTVWKVASPTGAVRGIELRSHRDEDRPKTLHYRHLSDPWVGYAGLAEGREAASRPSERHMHARLPGVRSKGPLVAVEDLLSAYRVATVYPAASIMGSHLTFETLMDLMGVSENIILCLDRDATQKAEKFAKRYAFICPGLVHVPLQQDLKYENKDRIKEIIEAAF